MLPDHKLELVPDWVDLPEHDERSWDMAYDLEPEFPDEPPEGWYEHEYCDVLREPYSPDGLLRAQLRFTLACQKEGLTPVGDVFVTAKYFCLRVRR